MKTLPLDLLLASAFFFAVVNSSNARVVTLTIGGAKTNDSIAIGTNEVATVLTGEGYGYVSWEKDGLSFGGQSAYYAANEFNPPAASARITHQPYKLVLAGPAKLNIACTSCEPYPSYLTVQLDSDQFPPDKTVIVPEGSGANIVLESSTNLINWTAATPGLYTNRTGNLFFRIRADRVP